MSQSTRPCLPMNQAIRIHAYLARSGLGSRREVEKWIQKGHILINKRPARLGEIVNPSVDHIKVKGKVIPFRKEEPTVIALYKPRGVVTTAKDPQGRSTVLDLIPPWPRVYPVGRLDIMSEGLLLLTNDGELAYHLMHPRFEVPKVYEVKIRGQLDQKKINYLTKGVKTSEEQLSGVEVLSIRDATKQGIKKYRVCVKIFEGKNRHLRRMFETVKCRVLRIKRIAIGSVILKGIPRGGYRILSAFDLKRLRKEVGLIS